ncbi:MAG: pentapeptide repeat-containing protein [Candidatus Coatesbacteria bacterium]|nr:pentapeptide repeat-containing protein [Candidatus Coatesbacteria bacterium]
MPNADDKPGHRKSPLDLDAEPGTEVCEKRCKLYTNLHSQSYSLRRAPVWGQKRCWKHLDVIEQDILRSKVQLQKQNLAGQNFWGADLSKLDLEGAKLDSAILRGANLTQTDLTGASLRGANLENAKLQNATLNGADLCEAKLEHAVLSGARIKKAGLRNARLHKANLSEADLSDSDLQGTDLTEARLDSANLFRARLQPLQYPDIVRMRDTDGTELRFPHDAKQRTKMQGAKLRKANLREADLTFVEAWNCDLYCADLEDATLIEADLWRSNLTGAILQDARLMGADLRWCRLHRVNLKRARIDGADMRGIRQVEYTKWVMLGDAFLWWVKIFRKLNTGRASLHKMRRDRLVRSLVYRSMRRAHRFCRRVGEAIQREKRYPLFSRASIAQGLLLTLRALIGRQERIASVTKWAGVSGVETCVVNNSLTRRYIRDAAYIENFCRRHRIWAFFWRWTCFYGQSFLLWAIWCLVIAVIFAAIYDDAELLVYKDKPVTGFWDCLYFSIVAFTTLGFGDITPSPGWARFFAAFEVILGYIGLGGLISILANKVARRA